MMPLFLKYRNTSTLEQMDDPDCDREELMNTYRQFRVVNSLISRWKTIYRRHIRPFCRTNNNRCSILDIGFGGGDIPVKLAKWCSSDGITPQITAIDTDPRAWEFVQQQDTPPTVNYRQISSTEMVKQQKLFDFVISNHLLHHLQEDHFYSMLEEAKKLSKQMVLFNDIHRSDLGYLLFNLLARPIFRSSFITEDGLTSIKRSYTQQELQQKVPEGWTVETLFPYRLLLNYRHASGAQHANGK